MNLEKIFDAVEKLPLTKKWRDNVETAKSIFISNNFKDDSSSIDKVFDMVNNEIGLRKDHLKQLLPILNVPFVAQGIDKVMPGSVKPLSALVNNIASNTSAQSNGDDAGYNRVIKNYPRKFNF